jgi:hypothetical protein
VSVVTKPVDRRELHNRIRHLRYSIIEEAIDVLKAEPTKECDRLIEVLLDSVKGLEAHFQEGQHASILLSVHEVNSGSGIASAIEGHGTNGSHE